MSNDTRAKWLEAQIKKRLNVLQRWVSNGVPKEYVVPSSLNKTRNWQNDSLGIEPIGSPKSFITTNKIHGPKISQISKLLQKLNTPQPKIQKTPIKQKLYKEKEKVLQYKESLVKAANQYAQLKILLEDTQRNLRIAQQTRKDLETEIKEVEQENKKLMAKLTKLNKKIGVDNITSIYSREY